MYDTLYVKSREEWREWLENNFQTKKEIWLICPRISSGKVRIQYNDAVEEALCFGWIDSILKTYDVHSTMQRYTPRKPASSYSQPNKERIKWLHQQNKIHPSILESIRFILDEVYVFPQDILHILQKDPDVWNNYLAFSDAYQRLRVAYIDSARSRSEEFEKRLKNFICKTKLNKKISGHGGIDKYY